MGGEDGGCSRKKVEVPGAVGGLSEAQVEVQGLCRRRAIGKNVVAAEKSLQIIIIIIIIHLI